MSRNLRFWVMSSTAIVAALSLNAQEIQMLNEIIIQALRNDAAVTTPSSVQILEGEDLEKILGNGTPLNSVIGSFVPEFAPSNGTIGDASQTLRGFSRELALIDSNSIERIEIIKGSSSEFGNGATGGDINIVTKSPLENNKTELFVGASSGAGKNSIGKNLSFSHERMVGALGLRLELFRNDLGNMYDGEGKLILSDPLVGQGGALSADWSQGSHNIKARIGGSYFQQDIRKFSDYTTNPVSVSALDYTGEDITDSTQYFNFSWHNEGTIFGNTELRVYESEVERRAAYVLPGIANTLYYPTSPTNPTQDPDSQGQLLTKTLGAQLTVNTPINAISDGAQLSWGLDFRQDNVEQKNQSNKDLIAPMRQNSIAAFAQLDVPIGDFEFSAGVRVEKFMLDVEDFVRPDAVQLGARGLTLLPAVNVIGGEFTYDALVGNIGVVWNVDPTLSLSAGYNQGFSIPDVDAFTRRAFPANSLLPNQMVSFESLKPSAQIVNTAELGAQYDSDGLSIAASAFLSTSEKGSAFDSAAHEITQQAERIWGGEFRMAYVANDTFKLGALLGYQEGKYDTDDDGEVESWLPNNRLPSPLTATLWGDYQVSNDFGMRSEFVYASGREKDGQPVLGDTYKVNITASYTLGNGKLLFGVNDLFAWHCCINLCLAKHSLYRAV